MTDVKVIKKALLRFQCGKTSKDLSSIGPKSRTLIVLNFGDLMLLHDFLLPSFILMQHSGSFCAQNRSFMCYLVLNI